MNNATLGEIMVYNPVVALKIRSKLGIGCLAFSTAMVNTFRRT